MNNLLSLALAFTLCVSSVPAARAQAPEASTVPSSDAADSPVPLVAAAAAVVVAAPALADAAAGAKGSEEPKTSAAAKANASPGLPDSSAKDPVLLDPQAFPAPDVRARQWFGYASPWTVLLLAALLVGLAALIHRVNPKRKRRIRTATILLGLYVTCFLLAALLHGIHAEGWARRVWQLADLFEVLVVIDLVGILLFDVLLLAMRVETTNIVHDLALGLAYVLAAIGMMHRSGVQLSGIIATSAVVTAVLGLSLQATLANVLGGLALQLDDSISVGDWVRLQNGKEGRVKAIRWRSAVIETRNWDSIIVPNSMLLGEQITLLGAREDQPRQHRMWVYFHIDFRFSPDEVIRVVEEALQSAPIAHVAASPRANCICTDFAQEHVAGIASYAVRFWLTDLAADDPAASGVRVRVYAALKRAQIPLAVPAHAIFVSEDNQEHAERKQERDLAKRLSALEAIDMLQGLQANERMELSRSMRSAPFSRGEVITRQGAAAHWLYVLVRGEVEVNVRVESGAEKLVVRMGAPNVFGEMGVMTGEPRTATVIAATECECYRIDKDAFQHLVQKRGDLAETISGIMAKRRVELQMVREDLDAEQRQRREQQEKSRILDKLQSFFGLSDDMD